MAWRAQLSKRPVIFLLSYTPKGLLDLPLWTTKNRFFEGKDETKIYGSPMVSVESLRS